MKPLALAAAVVTLCWFDVRPANAADFSPDSLRLGEAQANEILRRESGAGNLTVRSVDSSPQAAAHPGNERKVWQNAEVWLKPDVIVEANMIIGGVLDRNMGAPGVWAVLTAEGSRRLHDHTAANLGKPMALLLGDKVIEIYQTPFVFSGEAIWISPAGLEVELKTDPVPTLVPKPTEADVIEAQRIAVLIGTPSSRAARRSLK